MKFINFILLQIFVFLLPNNALALLRIPFNYIFLKSIEFDQPHLIHLCILLGADVNQKGEEGNTPLLHAAKFGGLSALKLLCDSGADINALNDYGRNALLIAMMNNHYKVAEYCLKSGIDPNSKSNALISSLFHTIKNGNLELTKLLLMWNVSVNETNLRNKETVLHYMALSYRPRKEIFFLLVKNGASLNQKDVKGRTPLILALEHQNFKVAKLLLDYGADIFIADNEANTPFILAANDEYNDIKIMAELALVAPALFDKKNLELGNVLKDVQLMWNQTAEDFITDEKFQAEEIEKHRSHKIRGYLMKHYSITSALRARELGNSKPLRFLNHLHPPNRKHNN